ncbi:MAG: hypothetical protein ABWX59_02810 [Microbacteriaceae bacterium]
MSSRFAVAWLVVALAGAATTALFFAETASFAESADSTFGNVLVGGDFVAYGLEASTVAPVVMYSLPFVTAAALIVAVSLALLFVHAMRWRPRGRNADAPVVAA